MEKKCANSNQVQKQHSLKRKDLKWILRNQDCARHPYREARRFFLSPETKPERHGLRKTQSLRWDRGAAARVCTDVPTPLENTLIGRADGYKEAYTGQPTDQSGNISSHLLDCFGK